MVAGSARGEVNKSAKTRMSSGASTNLLVRRQSAAAGAGQIALPRVASSTLQTTILLQSGQTAVLGGLKSKTEAETVTKLPLLGDIPLLGYLFKNRTKQETMSTLLVFITPQVIRSADDMESSMRRALEERMKDQRSSLAQTRDAIFGK